MRLQIVAARAFQDQHAARIDAMPARGHRDLPAPGEILARQRVRGEPDLLGRALRDDLPAVLARAGTHVHDVVGRADGIVVVLDDDHAVAEVAQVLQRREQPVVVALVQADRRLVQHVHDAGQPRADLRREPDALRLAAGERLRRAVEREIVEPDVVEKCEPAHDLLDDPVGDRVLLAVEGQPAEVVRRLAQRHPRNLVDRPRLRARADPDVPRLAPQPRAAAFRAGLRVEILRELLAHHQRVGLAVAALEVRDDALEHVLAHHRLAAVRQVGKGNLLVAAAGQDDLLHPFRQPGERPLEVEADVLRETAEHLEIELVASVPALDRARCERELRKRDDALRIEEADVAQTVAARAGAHRVVEGEQTRLELRERVAADRARELGGKEVLAASVHFDGDRTSVAVAQRGLVGFGQPLLQVRAHAEPIDDDLDRMLGCLRQPRHRVDFVHLAVDAHADETLRPQLDEEVELLALPVDDHRGQDHQLRVLGERQRRVDHLRNGHRGELLLRMLGTVRIADPRIEQPQVIVDLGDGAHRRARIVRRRLLLDRDGGRQPLDQVDVGLFHQLQELPRVGGQRLDVAALALGVERVEGERALAGAGQAGDDDQPVSRQIEVDVLEVVRARAADANVFHSVGLRPSGACRACGQPATIPPFRRHF